MLSSTLAQAADLLPLFDGNRFDWNQPSGGAFDLSTNWTPAALGPDWTDARIADKSH